MATVAVDVDGVLADQVGAILYDMKSRLGVDMARSEVQSWDEPVPGTDTDIKIEIERALLREEFVKCIPPLEGARQGVDVLRSRGFRIVIATSREASVDDATKEWLESQGLEYDEYMNLSSKGKGTVPADALVDDYPNNIRAFANEGGLGVLFRQPWNASATADEFSGDVEFAEGWEEVPDIVGRVV